MVLRLRSELCLLDLLIGGMWLELLEDLLTAGFGCSTLNCGGLGSGVHGGKLSGCESGPLGSTCGGGPRITKSTGRKINPLKSPKIMRAARTRKNMCSTARIVLLCLFPMLPMKLIIMWIVNSTPIPMERMRLTAGTALRGIPR